MGRLKQLFSRKRRFDELSEEIREHIDEKTSELIGEGMAPKDAAAAARREFGNVTLVEEDSRKEWRWAPIEDFLIDLRYALRTLRKSPGFTLVVVLTLALGIGANAAIFTLVDAVMLRMLPIERPQELAQVMLRNPRKGGQVSGAFTNSLWEQIRDHQDVFSKTFAWGTQRLDRARGGPVQLVDGNAGFDRNNVLLVSADLSAAGASDNRKLATYEAIEDRLRALPGVVAAGRCMVTPIQGGAWSQTVKTDWSGKLTEQESETWLNSVSAGHFDALRMTLLDGRKFATSDGEHAAKVAIVNQTMGRLFFPGVNPIGQTLRLRMVSGEYGPPIEVVGVAKDAKYESLREAMHPTAYFPDAQYPYPERNNAETFELRTATSPSALLRPVRDAIGSVSKGVSIELRTLARQVDDSMVQERLLALLSGFFGVLALLLATIGLYGTLSYLVSQRTPECGVRIALGAQRASILRLVMRDVLLVLGGGIVAGVALSLLATRILQDLLFQLPARDSVTFGVATGVLSGVAIAAGYLPARRATHVDPMVALRHE